MANDETIADGGTKLEQIKGECATCPMPLQSACNFRCATWRDVALQLEQDRGRAWREYDHLWAKVGELEKIADMLRAKIVLATAACRREIDSAKEAGERAKEGDTFPIVEAYRIIELQFYKLLEVLK